MDWNDVYEFWGWYCWSLFADGVRLGLVKLAVGEYKEEAEVVIDAGTETETGMFWALGVSTYWGVGCMVVCSAG